MQEALAVLPVAPRPRPTNCIFSHPLRRSVRVSGFRKKARLARTGCQADALTTQVMAGKRHRENQEGAEMAVSICTRDSHSRSVGNRARTAQVSPGSEFSVAKHPRGWACQG